MQLTWFHFLWLRKHGCLRSVPACVEWARLVNLQRSGSRDLMVAGGFRQHRRNVIRSEDLVENRTWCECINEKNC